jgi:hypothetical protein
MASRLGQTNFNFVDWKRQILVITNAERITMEKEKKIYGEFGQHTLKFLLERAIAKRKITDLCLKTYNNVALNIQSDCECFDILISKMNQFCSEKISSNDMGLARQEIIDLAKLISDQIDASNLEYANYRKIFR